MVECSLLRLGKNVTIRLVHAEREGAQRNAASSDRLLGRFIFQNVDLRIDVINTIRKGVGFRDIATSFQIGNHDLCERGLQWCSC
jgi:hypothetical protein